jgi:hypothetical protein
MGGLPAISSIAETIFRKIRRFRATYGAQPDEFVFP